MLAYRREFAELQSQMNKDVAFDGSRFLEKTLYTALIAESGGDSTTAEKNYEILASYNPYFEEGIIAAASFYRNKGRERLKPYNILAEAIQVNANSIRLLKAYISEASTQGFDDYANSSAEHLAELEAELR
jgi:hypothetical protein